MVITAPAEAPYCLLCGQGQNATAIAAKAPAGREAGDGTRGSGPCPLRAGHVPALESDPAHAARAALLHLSSARRFQVQRKRPSSSHLAPGPRRGWEEPR